jgi:hypothetical protein
MCHFRVGCLDMLITAKKCLAPILTNAKYNRVDSKTTYPTVYLLNYGFDQLIATSY